MLSSSRFGKRGESRKATGAVPRAGRGVPVAAHNKEKDSVLPAQLRRRDRDPVRAKSAAPRSWQLSA